MNPILFGDGKAKGLIPLPSGKVGAYCIRLLALPAKGGKAQGSIFLPVECVGAYRIRPLILPAKDRKAQGSLFPIRVGRGLGGTFLNPILFGDGKAGLVGRP